MDLKDPSTFYNLLNELESLTKQKIQEAKENFLTITDAKEKELGPKLDQEEILMKFTESLEPYICPEEEEITEGELENWASSKKDQVSQEILELTIFNRKMISISINNLDNKEINKFKDNWMENFSENQRKALKQLLQIGADISSKYLEKDTDMKELAAFWFKIINEVEN